MNFGNIFYGVVSRIFTIQAIISLRKTNQFFSELEVNRVLFRVRTETSRVIKNYCSLVRVNNDT
jgi:hypothetical protein